MLQLPNFAARRPVRRARQPYETSVVIAGDNAAHDALRMEAATAVARLSSDTVEFAFFEGLAAKHLDAREDRRHLCDACG